MSHHHFALDPKDARVAASSSAIYQPQAIMQLLHEWSELVELDAVLQKAGKSRTELRALEGDDEISAALETRESALLATPWRLDPWIDDPVAEFAWDTIEPFMERILRSAFSALPYGYSVIEIVWRRDTDGRIRIATADEKPFEWFEPKRDGVLLYYPTHFRYSGVGEPVDTGYKFFLTTRKATYRNPRGEPLLSRLFWPWFMRSKGWQFWARFLERFGSPMMIGKTLGDVESMADTLAKLVNAGAAAFGKDDEIVSVSPGNAGTAFEMFSASVDKRIQKVVLGQTLTTDVQGGGSYAAAKVQDMVRQDRLLADIRMVTPTLQRVVNAITWLNFPDATPPRLVIEAGESLGAERAARDATLVNAGVLKLTPQYLLNRYDYEEGDFVVPELASSPIQPTEENPAQPVQASLMLGWKGRRFTEPQEALDALIEDTVREAGSPIQSDAIRAAILESEDPEEMSRRLADIMRDDPPEQFQHVFERALFATDVMGYTAAHVKRTGRLRDG